MKFNLKKMNVYAKIRYKIKKIAKKTELCSVFRRILTDCRV